MTQPIAFVDVETTGVDPTRHHLWEVAVVLRNDGVVDIEYCWQVRPDLSTADPMALKISRYYERAGAYTSDDDWTARQTQGPGTLSAVDDAADVAKAIALLLNGTVLAAANVAFDAAFIAKFLRANSQAPAWDYHLLEVESYAAGAIGMQPPWKLDKLAAELGVMLPQERHTALVDARLARDVYAAARKQGARGWAGGVRWAADEADAQAEGREPVAMVDVTDHLRLCADNPNRKSAVAR